MPGKTKQKRNVLFISQAANLYGSERTLLALLGSVPDDVNPLIVTQKSGPLHDELQRLRVESFDFKFNQVRLAQNPKWHMSLFRRLRHLLKEYRPEAIILVYEGNVPLLVATARSVGIPVFRILQRPLTPVRRNLAWVADKTAFWLCSGVFCGSPVLQKQVLDECVFLRRPQTRLTRLPVRTTEPMLRSIEEVRQSWGIPTEAPVIGQFSRLHPVKGIDRLIDAAHSILCRRPDAWFVVGGEVDGSPEYRNYRAHLESRVHLCGLQDRFKFLGFVQDVLSAVRASDVIVMPSISEGVGISCLEALLLERPVIGSNVDGLGEILASSKGGIPLDTSQTEVFANEILNLLANSELRSELGYRGKRWVLDNCSPTFFCNEFWQGLGCFLNRPFATA